MNKKVLLQGNEAVARGVYEAGCLFVSSYPGTPSTEITENISKYEEIYSEWAPNEKVAMEAAIGASIRGARSFCGQKHVGLNVAADPLFTASYTGVTGGLVIAVADDSGMHSSQNEQDSRHYAVSAKIPMLEPADSGECLEYTKLAFELSEEFDTPVLLRLTTRISHSQSMAIQSEITKKAIREYKKDAAKYVMMPAMARQRHVFVEQRQQKLQMYANTSSINAIEDNFSQTGVITAGIAYQYAKEALGDRVNYLKLGIVNPLPKELIEEFAAKVKTLYIIEELDPVIEEQVKAMGINCFGKDVFSLTGEYTAQNIKNVILKENTEVIYESKQVPNRPPVMCSGCPHRGAFYVLNKLKLFVFGDIGCYTLGALPPANAMDACICMGASISGLHGFDKVAGDTKSIAVIGDSTFMHSGITGLIDIVYNKGASTVLILDNRTTGMTGHQQNPATGFTIKGESTYKIDIEAVCKAVGINRVIKINPDDVVELEKVIKAEIESKQPSVIIAEKPCALLKDIIHPKYRVVDTDACVGCKVCLKMGCPSLTVKNRKAVIDKNTCRGCDLCRKICRKNAIKEETI